MSGIIDTVGSKSGIIGSDNYPAGVIDASVTGGAGLTGSTSLGTVTAGNLSNDNIVYPTDHVIQVVSESAIHYTVDTTINTWHSLGATLAITPTTSSSKILLFYNSGTNYQEDNVNFYAFYTFLRYIAAEGGSESNSNDNLGHATGGFGGTYTSAQGIDDYGFKTQMHYLDSPGVDTVIRYRVYQRFSAGTLVHNLSGTETITAMELAA